MTAKERSVEMGLLLYFMSELSRIQYEWIEDNSDLMGTITRWKTDLFTGIEESVHISLTYSTNCSNSSSFSLETYLHTHIWPQNQHFLKKHISIQNTWYLHPLTPTLFQKSGYGLEINYTSILYSQPQKVFQAVSSKAAPLRLAIV